jgi:hypothetical protein
MRPTAGYSTPAVTGTPSTLKRPATRLEESMEPIVVLHERGQHGGVDCQVASRASHWPLTTGLPPSTMSRPRA